MELLEQRRHLTVDLVASYGFISWNPQTGAIASTAVVMNLGDTTPAGGYTLRWFLSRDKVVNNSDDIVLKEVRVSGGPQPNKEFTRSDAPVIGYTVPYGSYFVGFAADANSEIPEAGEINNYQFTSAQVIDIPAQPIVATGTSGDDTIFLSTGRDLDGNAQLVLTVNGTNSRYNPFRVSSVHLNGNGGDDLITVGPDVTLAVSADGGDGNDRITGGAGDDTLSGGAGKDMIRGSDGRDRLNGNGGNDNLFGEAGADRLYGYNGSDYLDGGSSNDRLDGGAGSDTLIGQGGSDNFYTRDKARDFLFGSSGIDYAQTDSIDSLSSVERSIA